LKKKQGKDSLHLHWPKANTRLLEKGSSLKGLKKNNFFFFFLWALIFFNVMLINKAYFKEGKTKGENYEDKKKNLNMNEL
jgi:hypothetical protein